MSQSSSSVQAGGEIMLDRQVKMHPFERAGLGVAPFRLVGYGRETYQAVPGDSSCPVQVGTSCYYCGQGISNVCYIKDVNGKVAKVGCDCVRKTCADFDNSLVSEMEAKKREAERVKRAEKAEARREVARARRERLWKAFEAAPALFTDRPHPNAYYASQGRTFRDYIAFIRTGWAYDQIESALSSPLSPIEGSHEK